MSTTSEIDSLSPYGSHVPYVRTFGWGMLAVLVAFMINNVLSVGYDFPPIRELMNGNALSWVPLAVYLAGIGCAWWYVAGSPDRALRYDARKISAFNAYLIRACFFSVLFVGIADAAIAFLRVEGLLPLLFSENLSKELIRARFIGPWIHFPLIGLSFVIAYFSRSLGFIWLALMIVVAELLILISRFVFSYEQALMGDLVRYWYAALFLFSSAYTLMDEGHVRVDVFYAGFQQRTKGKINAIGSIMLGMTTCWVVIIIGFGSKQSIINSPVTNFEVSQTGTAGMFIKYQMAAFLAIFAITMLIQFVSYLFEAVADKRDEPGRRVVAEITH